MWSVGEYWPWWLSACALAVVAVGFLAFERRLLGVSGSFARLESALEHPELERSRAAMQSAAPDALTAALLAATAKEFGEVVPAPVSTAAPIAGVVPVPPAPWTAHLAFVLCLALGGLLASAVRQGWRLQFDLGPTFASLVGSGWKAIAVLLVGGTLTGFGTQMAGGCTSGHGLTGCARLQRGSLLTTATFFGTAVVFSLGWAWVHG